MNLDPLWRRLFPSSNDPLQRRIRLMGALVAGVTLSTTLIGTLVDAPDLGQAFLGLAGRLAACAALSGLSALPFVVGAHVGARTGWTRLLFGLCLVLLFVALAVRAFLFFEYVQARVRGGSGPEGVLVALIVEPLGAAALLGLLSGLGGDDGPSSGKVGRDRP